MKIKKNELLGGLIAENPQSHKFPNRRMDKLRRLATQIWVIITLYQPGLQYLYIKYMDKYIIYISTLNKYH